ncbi:hypothetical protein G4O51_09435 [Candidatus Bathyarchaeota archaeon A05DMB-2]|nr:hypothetical protein [Candidatus Bathyarchaeota archaeon A05DMB-2]
MKVAIHSDRKAEKGSQKWIQKLINKNVDPLDSLLKQNLNLPEDEKIDWLSPLEKNNYAEYYDNAFLEKLGLSALIPELRKFWPKGGPHWDGIGKSESRKVFLVEAKSHIPELMSWLKATDPNSKQRIQEGLKWAKKKLGSKTDFDWSKAFYQYANRLAHVEFLRQNKVEAYFVSVYFLNDAEMNGPKTADEWKGALRLLHRCLGLEEHILSKRIVELFIDVNYLK